MPHVRPIHHEDVTVDDELARRILARAAELDSQRGVSLQDLRLSATEAGISPRAFRAALAEVQGDTGNEDEPVYLMSDPWWRIGYLRISSNPYLRQSAVAAAAAALAAVLLSVTGYLVP